MLSIFPWPVIRVYNALANEYRDVAIALGGAPVSLPPGSLGTVYDTFYIGPRRCKQQHNGQ
jgi:hypothetical protein